MAEKGKAKAGKKHCRKAAEQKPAKPKKRKRGPGKDRPKYSLKQVLAAIKDTGGVKIDICERLGCSRHTFDSYLEKFPKIAEAYNEECDSMGDLAEARLFKNIDGGDMTAIMYYLNNKGKNRGYNRPKENDDRAKPVDVVINLVSPAVQAKLQAMGLIAPPAKADEGAKA